jgi:hypothetical protein
MKHHLRDAFRCSQQQPRRCSASHQDNKSIADDTLSSSSVPLRPIETAAMLLFFPLLKRVDHKVYHDLIVFAKKYHPMGLPGGIEVVSNIVAQHITTWFCQAFSKIETTTSPPRTTTSTIPSLQQQQQQQQQHMKISSRLADVFICSHPLMPFYIAAATLSIRRRYCHHHSTNTAGSMFEHTANPNSSTTLDFCYAIKQLFYFNTIVEGSTTTSASSLHETAPNDILLNQVVEEIIACAIRYMYVFKSKITRFYLIRFD